MPYYVARILCFIQTERPEVPISFAKRPCIIKWNIYIAHLPDAIRAEPSRAEPSRAESSRAESSRAEASRAEPD
jgi:hypothetical protein